jgi:hypothetical protein
MGQSDLLRFLCLHLERIGLRYFITGSQATIAFGEPRFTNDIDVVVELDEATCDRFCDGFPEEDFYLNRETAHQECRRHGMFNIIQPSTGLKIDVIVAKPASRDLLRLDRCIKIPISADCMASFSSPEDIILKKLEWHQMGGGDRHLRDIAGIVKVSGETLDWNYLAQSAQELGLTDLWNSVREACR